MDDVDRGKLTSNRSFMVKNITKTMNLVDILMDERIITDGMKQDIEAERTPDDKNRKLLDIIPRRGPKAFEAFLKALVETDHDFVADRLSPGTGDKYRLVRTSSEKGMVSPVEENHPIHEPEIVLPKKWPTEEDCVTDFEVKKCGRIAEEMWRKESNDFYKMRSKPRGRALIFNNFVAIDYRVKDENSGEWKTKLQKRDGTDRDEQCLRRLFEQLHFDVEVKKDRSLEKMRGDIEEEKEQPFHKAADCFIVVFLSHGSADGIYGIDGKVLTTAEVKRSFNNKNFSSMTNKPKLIFIQACRGETYDLGSNATDSFDADLADARKSMGAMNFNTPQPEGQDEANTSQLRGLDEADSKVEKSPSYADMFIANATTQDYVSFRNKKYGSWFIQAMVYVFRNYACRAHLLDMFTLVNRLVSEGRAQDLQRNIAVAISEFTPTLRHKLFFFPGLTEVVTHSPQN